MLTPYSSYFFIFLACLINILIFFQLYDMKIENGNPNKKVSPFLFFKIHLWEYFIHLKHISPMPKSTSSSVLLI